MLKLYGYDVNVWTTEARASIPLDKAENVRVSREVNGVYNLSFSYPKDTQGEIAPLKIVECEGQLYRIISLSKALDETNKISVECTHVFHYDSVKIHLPNVPDMIGVSPRDVLSAAFLELPSKTPFTIFTDKELSEMNMKWIDFDGFKMDFFSTDKTTPYDVLQTVIDSCGKGEVYIDNYKFALVERVGYDCKATLRTDLNVSGLTITRDGTDVITRLYPYGDSDLDISTIEPDGKYYVDSPNIGVYGILEGHKDYTYTSPEKLLSNALYEFDEINTSRLDVPAVNISGEIIDINKISDRDISELDIGDGVTVYDDGVKIFARILRIEKYPYEPMLGSAEIGQPKRDLFFYLNQMGRAMKDVNRIITASGFVDGKKVRS